MFTSKFFEKKIRQPLSSYPEFRKQQQQAYYQYFSHAYRKWHYNSAKTAEKLNIPANTLRSILQRLGLYKGSKDFSGGRANHG